MKATYMGGLRVECEHEDSGAKIITDAPLDNHGQGRSFSPTDLATVALPACMLTIMGIYAENIGLDIRLWKILLAKRPSREKDSARAWC